MTAIILNMDDTPDKEDVLMIFDVLKDQTSLL